MRRSELSGSAHARGRAYLLIGRLGRVERLARLDFANRIAMQLEELLDQLGDEQLKTIAIGKMEGYTNEELASRLSITTRTVERRLQRIRERWSDERE